MQRAEQGGGIFVSYSRKHEGLVTPLVWLLRLGDRLVFLDVDSVPLGAKWHHTIFDSLKKCDIFIIIWCIHSSKSQWVDEEVQTAVGLVKQVVPIMIDRTPLPDFLAQYQGIDLHRQVIHSETPLVWPSKRTIIFILLSIIMITIYTSLPIAAVLTTTVVAVILSARMVIRYARGVHEQRVLTEAVMKRIKLSTSQARPSAQN